MKRVGKNEKGALKGETELDCEKEKNQKKSAQKKNKFSFSFGVRAETLFVAFHRLYMELAAWFPWYSSEIRISARSESRKR